MALRSKFKDSKNPRTYKVSRIILEIKTKKLYKKNMLGGDGLT